LIKVVADAAAAMVRYAGEFGSALKSADMASFDIAWERSRVEQYRRTPENAPWSLSAVLLERILVERGPALKCGCRLSSILEDELWNRCTARPL